MKAQKLLKNVFKGDTAICVIYLLLSLISLIAVYSSIGLSAIVDSGSTPLKQFIKHLLFVVASYVVVIFFANLDYRGLSKWSPVFIFIAGTILAAAIVFHWGRWVNLGVATFQPSELAKPAIILFLSRELTLHKDRVKEWPFFRQLIILMAIIAGLILPENFSTAALVCVVSMLVMLYGGVNFKYWTRVVLIVAVFAGIGLFVAYKEYTAKEELRQHEIATVNDEGNKPLPRIITWGHRMDSWLHPDVDALTQENMSRMAVASGKIFGVGTGATVQARLMTQAHNDFIYAVIIEEKGMLAGIIIFLLYTILFHRCIKIAQRCKEQFGKLCAAGLGSLIYIQAVVNMCVVVGVLPVTGQTLPLISYGGTSYLCMGAIVGMIQSVAFATMKTEKIQKEQARRDAGFEELKELAGVKD